MDPVDSLEKRSRKLKLHIFPSIGICLTFHRFPLIFTALGLRKVRGDFDSNLNKSSAIARQNGRTASEGDREIVLPLHLHCGNQHPPDHHS